MDNVSLQDVAEKVNLDKSYHWPGVSRRMWNHSHGIFKKYKDRKGKRTSFMWYGGQ